MSYCRLSLLLAAACALSLAIAPAGWALNLNVAPRDMSNGLDHAKPRSESLRPFVHSGLDCNFANGFYLGNWSPTGKFGDTDFALDLYDRYDGLISTNLLFDVGLLSFLSPGTGSVGDGNHAEASLSHIPTTFKYTKGVSDVVDQFVHLILGDSRAPEETSKPQATLGMRNNQAGGFGAFSLGLNHDMGDGSTAVVSFFGTSKDPQMGWTFDNLLVFSLIKGFWRSAHTPFTSRSFA